MLYLHVPGPDGVWRGCHAGTCLRASDDVNVMLVFMIAVLLLVQSIGEEGEG